jgi:diguanylate cyclase (GGDEF)-like protein
MAYNAGLQSLVPSAIRRGAAACSPSLHQSVPAARPRITWDLLPFVKSNLISIAARERRSALNKAFSVRLAAELSMKLEIKTHRDIVVHTSKRVGIAVAATMILASAMIVLEFGTEFYAYVPVHTVLTRGVTIGMIIATALTAVLTYRSGILMLELNKARAELLKLSRTDQLTGLLNRRGYVEAATKILTEARAGNRSAVALMCDLDRFKAINDRYGHDFGDQLLIEVGAAMRAFGKDHNALVARHGGEEFVALMVDVTAEEAVRSANALRRLCAATMVVGERGTAASVTISIGLATSTEQADLPAMMRAADEALYLAKSTGRDRVVQTSVDVAA